MSHSASMLDVRLGSAASRVASAYGFAALNSVMCPRNVAVRLTCVQRVNTTAIAVHFQRAVEYDISRSDAVAVEFPPAFFMPARTEPVTATIIIVPTNVKNRPSAVAASLVVAAAMLASAYVAPFSFDVPPLAMALQSGCTRQSARGWLPMSDFILFPTGGESWLMRVGIAFSVCVGSALLVSIVGYVLTKGVRSQLPNDEPSRLPHAHVQIEGATAHDATAPPTARRRTSIVDTMRRALPFGVSLLFLLFSPGFAFAAGALLSSSNAIEEAAAVATCVASLIGWYFIHGWLFRRGTTCVFVPSSSEAIAVLRLAGGPHHRATANALSQATGSDVWSLSTLTPFLLRRRGVWRSVIATAEDDEDSKDEGAPNAAPANPAAIGDHAVDAVLSKTGVAGMGILRCEVVGGLSRRVVLWWVAHAILYFFAGLDANDALQCVGQRVFVAIGLVVSIPAMIVYPVHRLRAMMMFSAAIRICVAGVFAAAIPSSSESMFALANTMCFFVAALALGRVVFVLGFADAGDAIALRGLVTATLLAAEMQAKGNENRREPPDEPVPLEIEAGDAASGASSPMLSPARALVVPLLALEAPQPVEGAAPGRSNVPWSVGDLPPSPAELFLPPAVAADDGNGTPGAAEGDEDYNDAASVATATTWLDAATQPAWIQQARRTRHNNAREETRERPPPIGPNGMMWLPTARPHVRTHNDPALPVNVVPYVVRGTRSAAKR